MDAVSEERRDFWHAVCTCLLSESESQERIATGRRELIFNTIHTSSISPVAQPKDDSL
jgi:hypothetical protein